MRYLLFIPTYAIGASFPFFVFLLSLWRVHSLLHFFVHWRFYVEHQHHSYQLPTPITDLHGF
jgi:hypothetical protein